MWFIVKPRYIEDVKRPLMRVHIYAVHVRGTRPYRHSEHACYRCICF